MTRGSLLPEAVSASGGHARPPAGSSDVVDGVTPGVVVEPVSADGMSAVLRWASSSRLTVVVRGSGSKDAWGRPPQSVDVLLRTSGLRRIVAHETSDLTATLEAGARLQDVNRELARHGQCLPVDPPHPDATIGGILATNDSGPLRHKYGTPRDLVIGMTYVMADGLVAASGGRVVKNVAGYDIGRMLAGSHGCLAAIAVATFKLAPLAPTSRTVRAHMAAPADTVALVDRLRQQQCEPEALDVHVSRRGPVDRVVVLARASSVDAAVAETVEQVTAIAEALGATVESSGGPQADTWWATQRDADAAEGLVCLRVAWKPADFARAADIILAETRGLDVDIAGRAATGSGMVSFGGETERQATVIAALRASPALRHVVILSAPRDLRRRIDVWGTDLSKLPVGRALKTACDPGDTLGAARGPL